MENKIRRDKWCWGYGYLLVYIESLERKRTEHVRVLYFMIV